MASNLFFQARRTLYRYGAAGMAIALAAGLWSSPDAIAPRAMLDAAWSGRAQAQTPAAISPQEVQQYARSVLRIETLRTVALRQIQPLVDEDALQRLACHQSDSVRRLPAQAKDIFVNYCAESVDVVEQSGLSIARFNEITVAQPSDPQLTNQVQQTLRRLQLDAISAPPSRQPAPQPQP
ncbi:MAG: DUF4168 domain-containing protein [Elainellaceae cyanobacterium]